MILVGSLFLLERFDYISTSRVWDFWPMILIVIGLTQNAAAGHDLPREALHSETLRVGIAAVARASESFLVCHCEPSFERES